MSVYEAAEHAVTSFDIDIGETMTLWNLGIRNGVAIQARELKIESCFPDQTGTKQKLEC